MFHHVDFDVGLEAEEFQHLIVNLSMLAGRDQTGIETWPLTCSAEDRRELDRFGTRAHDCGNT